MILDILEYPDSRLRKIAAPVAVVTADIRRLVRDMAQTMYAAPGIGLAATQVNVHKRIIVIDVSPTHDDLKVFINPELVFAAGESGYEEGCLSVPGYYEAVSHSGITLAPVIGRLLASEILSGKRDEMLADFRPERFP